MFLDAAMSGRRVFSMQASAKASTCCDGWRERVDEERVAPGRLDLGRGQFARRGSGAPAALVRMLGQARFGARTSWGREGGTFRASIFTEVALALTPVRWSRRVPWAVASSWWGTVDLGRGAVYQELLHAAGRTN